VLDNAHKYSPDQREILVRVESDGRNPEVTIAVRDHGVGIDETDLTRVLMPFHRTDRSRARGTGGIGLGLSLAKQIVDAYGGSIRLRSKPDEGTGVTISLPIADQDDV
jgi:signal transduction histidine kinase